MVTTDGSWQDITASYVRSEQPVEYRGHEQVRRDSLQDGGLPQPVPRPQGPRRALPRPPLPVPPVETLDAPMNKVEESLLDVSSDSWATLPSDNPSVADTSTESIGPVLPGAFKNSSMSQSINNQSSFTPRHSQFALYLKREEENDDPFLTDSMSNRPLSATSNGTDSTIESDWVPPIASSSSTPKKAQPKLRQHAVRSPRSARPAPPASDYIASRSMRSPASSVMRSLDPHATPRRRKGSSVSREDSPEPRAPRRRQKRESSWLPIAKDIYSLLFTVISLPITTLARTVGAPVQDAIKWIIILSFFCSVFWLLIRSPMQTALCAVQGASSIVSLGPLLYSGLKSPARLYCNTIGIGCSSEHEHIDVGKLAKQVGTQALQAHDMFTSVVALGDPAALALNHVEIWELAVAVQVSSGMENREELGRQLAQFGTKVRDVKDAMYVLHSKGITTFQWALHRFTRLEKTLALAESKPNAYTTKRIKKQLDELFEHLDASLKDLLRGVETAIPIANQASDEGGEIRKEFGSEKSRMQKARDNQPFWRRLKDIGTHSGRQLREDIRMTTDTIDTVKELRFNLENTRSFLINYRDQVGYFKSGFQGFHIGDHGLDPEDEVATLRDIMQRFEDSVEKARYASSPEGLREAITARQKTLND